MIRPPPTSTLFPYTTLFRSLPMVNYTTTTTNNNNSSITDDPLEASHLFSAFLLPSSESSDLRSEEHTSELQSQSNLVCRLLLEKKKKNRKKISRKRRKRV